MSRPTGRIYLSATRKSSGKTCIATGLLRALRERGHTVSPYKKGPDYIDPMWLGKAAGQPCYNLDFHTQSHDEILACAGRAEGLAVIEGNKGLYDGVSTDGSDSNAALARTLGAPVVLVLDCEGMTRGVAPLVLGYREFDPEVRFAGVILNRTAGSRHEGKLRRALEEHTDVPVLGVLGRQEGLELAERHLGLIPCAEQDDAEDRIRRMADTVEQGVDLAALVEAAGQDSARESRTVQTPPTPVIRIGYPHDAAFGFYYADDLERFALLGAELVPFDTLRDDEPPEVDGLWIGGGFPETRAEGLSRNVSMRFALRERIQSGLVTYAECGGLMYLSRGILYEGATHEMVAAVPADCEVLPRPQGRGLVELEATADFPWPGVEAGRNVPAHEFHYSRLTGLPDDCRYGWKMRRGDGFGDGRDGLVSGSIFATYSHLRHTDRFEWIRHFVAHVRARA